VEGRIFFAICSATGDTDVCFYFPWKMPTLRMVAELSRSPVSMGRQDTQSAEFPKTSRTMVASTRHMISVIRIFLQSAQPPGIFMIFL